MFVDDIGYQYFQPIQERLLTMSSSKFNFYLTGSRYFGNATEKSDWEFFVQYDKEIVKYLLDLGFKRNHNEKAYDDKGISAVYTFVPSDYTGFEDVSQLPEHIDVQLCNQAWYKFEVQKYIKHKYLEELIACDKSKRKDIWNRTYDEIVERLNTK